MKDTSGSKSLTTVWWMWDQGHIWRSYLYWGRDMYLFLMEMEVVKMGTSLQLQVYVYIIYLSHCTVQEVCVCCSLLNARCLNCDVAYSKCTFTWMEWIFIDKFRVIRERIRGTFHLILSIISLTRKKTICVKMRVMGRGILNSASIKN